jgi:hypothetical protein
MESFLSLLTSLHQLCISKHEELTFNDSDYDYHIDHNDHHIIR